MLDLAYIRENKDKVREALKIRAPKLDFEGFLGLDVRRREVLQEVDTLRAERNKANDRITALLKEKKGTKAEIESMKVISQKIKEFDVKMEEFDSKVKEIMYIIPNIPHISVKNGVDSTQNTEVLSWGAPKKFE